MKIAEDLYDRGIVSESDFPLTLDVSGGTRVFVVTFMCGAIFESQEICNVD